MKKFYITTAIDYVNAPAPHIGHALEKIGADVLARYHRLKGNDVFFLTGTDENAQKNVLAAEKAGVSVERFVAENAANFKKMGGALNISFDDFIRTADEEKHWPGVKKLWKKCDESGDIYKKKYEGLYCVGCEAFVTEKDLINGHCPEHLKEPEKISEENYFFSLSKYQEKIEELVKNDIVKIIPEKRKNEVLSFVRSGLKDLSISRPTERMKDWGISVPGDKSQIIYCWMDALANYITALGYGREENKLFKKYWPADVHVIGKGIVRFHAVYWPAFLLSAEIELPKKIFVHDYITVSGQKMSKTIGNVINPLELAEKYGTDAIRYYLLREISPFKDGDFTYKRFEERYNADLANGLGNLLSRVLKMAEDVFKGEVDCKPDKEFEKLFSETSKKVDGFIKGYEFHKALEAVWEVIGFCDAYIEEKKPWETKDERVLKSLLASLFIIARLLRPFLPDTSERMLKQLGTKDEKENWCMKPKKGSLLFPKLE